MNQIDLNLGVVPLSKAERRVEIREVAGRTHQQPVDAQAHVLPVAIADRGEAGFQSRVAVLPLDVGVIISARAIVADRDLSEAGGMERADALLEQNGVGGDPRQHIQLDRALDDAGEIAMEQRFTTIQPYLAHAGNGGIDEQLLDDGKGKLAVRHEVAPVPAADAAKVALRGDCHLQPAGVRLHEHWKQARRALAPAVDPEIERAQLIPYRRIAPQRIQPAVDARAQSHFGGCSWRNAPNGKAPLRWSRNGSGSGSPATRVTTTATSAHAGQRQRLTRTR